MRVPIRRSGKYSNIKPDPFITSDKLKEIKKRLQVLKKQLPSAILEVKRLSELGDFSENAGYAIAKGHLRSLQDRIRKLENQLKSAEIISPQKSRGLVDIGSKVVVKVNNQKITYHILGSLETNPSQGIISYRSPLGSLLLNHKVGDKVRLITGKISKEYQIIAIE